MSGRWRWRATSIRSGRFGERRRQRFSHGLLQQRRVAEDAASFGVAGGEDEVPLADHFPGHVAAQEPLPSGRQFALAPGRSCRPAGDIDQQRPLGEVQVRVEVVERVAGKEVLAAVGEQVLQRQVDGPDGAVEIDGAKQFGPHAHEAHQRVDSAVMDRQAAVGEEAVMQQPLEVERPRAVAGHVGVAEDEVHVVDGVDAAEQSLRELRASAASPG